MRRYNFCHSVSKKINCMDLNTLKITVGFLFLIFNLFIPLLSRSSLSSFRSRNWPAIQPQISFFPSLFLFSLSHRSSSTSTSLRWCSLPISTEDLRSPRRSTTASPRASSIHSHCRCLTTSTRDPCKNVDLTGAQRRGAFPDLLTTVIATISSCSGLPRSHRNCSVFCWAMKAISSELRESCRFHDAFNSRSWGDLAGVEEGDPYLLFFFILLEFRWLPVGDLMVTDR